MHAPRKQKRHRSGHGRVDNPTTTDLTPVPVTEKKAAGKYRAVVEMYQEFPLDADEAKFNRWLDGDTVLSG